MKTVMITAAVVVGIVINVANAAPLPEAKPDDVGFSQQGLTRLDEFFAREIAAKRVPGAVVTIARDGKLVHYKAYGQLDATKGTPMPPDAIFSLYSMTKPMAAVAGLTLMEQGRLPLQAKVADYYPVFSDMKVGVQQSDGSLKLEAQASPIYIHDLYRHTSGLMYGGRPDSSSPVASVSTRTGRRRPSRAIHKRSLIASRSCRWRTSRGRFSSTGFRLTCWARSSKS
jgi:CubicO group peptidase (beta-lactamase class C family)